MDLIIMQTSPASRHFLSY